ELDGGPDGREIDLRFSSVPGRFWRLCGLVIVDPDSTLPPVLLTDVSAPEVWFGGRPNAVVATVANLTTDRSVSVTVSCDVPEGWTTEPVTVEIPPDTELEVTAAVTPPPEPALGTIVLRCVAAGTEEET